MLEPPLPVAAAAVAVASAGFAASLPLQERLVALTPADVRGQALGLHSSGMMTMQGVGAALAGVIAQHTSPVVAMPAMAGASLLVTVCLAPGLRADRSRTPSTQDDESSESPERPFTRRP
ncbi:MFS transporter [Nonomuraea longicatena]|uniref:MFS transporter n=1 Tax=Nonomuraea longicatena TaxID=83682 RepID=A0ABP4ADZ8_9ACTN